MITFIAVSFAIFHLYTGMFGSFPPYLQRPIHLTFAAVLAFLLNVPLKDKKNRFWAFFDILFSVVSLVIFGYFVWQNEVISEWIPFGWLKQMEED